MADEVSRTVPRRCADPEPAPTESWRPPAPSSPGRRALVDPVDPPSAPRRAGRRFAPVEPEVLPEESAWDQATIATPESRAEREPVPDHPVQDDADPEPEPPDRPNRRGRRLLLLIGACFLIVALVVVGWFTLLPRVPASQSASPTPTEATSPPASPSSDPESTEGATEAPGPLELNDTTITAPPGWNLYRDEIIEGDRRVIRLSHAATDIRLQVATLAAAGPDASATCEAVSASMQATFSDVTPTPTLPIGIDPAQGTGVTCGFRGTRTADGVANTVSFTVVIRVSDGHILTLRSVIPDTAVESSGAEAARGELAAMNCSASRNFQVTLPLC